MGVTIMDSGNMVVKPNKILLIILFSSTFTESKVPTWPMEEMAKILSQSCTDSDNCSAKLFSSVLHNCVNSENEMEDYLDSVGSTTGFRRSTAESKEIAKLFMVSMRMKKALNNLAAQRKMNMRSYGISLEKTIDGFCEELTNELKVCQNIKCDSESKYRTIDGCCNNLKKSNLGAPFAPFTRLILPDYDDGVGLPRGGLTSSRLP